MTNPEYVTALRHLADWFEAHPDMEPPYKAETVQFIAGTKDECAAVIRAAGGAWDKRASGGLLYFTQIVGWLTLELLINQEQVCTKRVVGHREVPAQPARVVEIVEWDCNPVLA